MSAVAAPAVPGPRAHPPERTLRALAVTSLGALGVVYADIGTSPLYAIRECLAWHPAGAHAGFSPHAAAPTEANVLGVLSLVFWSLVVVICVKYLVFVVRADNKGEGGILALAALVVGGDCRARGRRLAWPLVLGVLGTGLLLGDGAITPAISVLGAMEGLAEHSPRLGYLVEPITIMLLIGLFTVQRFTSLRLARAFGPIMLVWFVVLASLGAAWIAREPQVLAAISPAHAARFLAGAGVRGFLVIGMVFLVVTGGEALYAQLGAFGRLPVRVAWFAIALPALVLDYFGQGAVLLAHPVGTVHNPFYAMVSGPMQIPLLILATVAALIASQALLAAVFSLTRQAMQLGFWPRVRVVHTSPSGHDVYIPQINVLLMIASVVLVLELRTTSGLAAAYGVAVSGAMALTTVLFYAVARRTRRWTRARALAFAAPMLAVDVAFLAANAGKLFAGAWVPLAIAGLAVIVMSTWWRGRQELAELTDAGAIADDVFLDDFAARPRLRVPGTAIVLSSTPAGIPNVLLHHLKHNKALHEHVILLSLETLATPYADRSTALDVRPLGHGFYRAHARFGFLQATDVPRLLADCRRFGVTCESMETTYYLGRRTLLTNGRIPIARWRKRLFAFLSRNAPPPAAVFHLPPNRVVELGAQIVL